MANKPSQLVAIEELALQNGTVVINDATEFVLPMDAYYIAEETVIATLKINTVDMLSDYVTTPATPIKAGVIISPQRGDVFSSIQLTSGSVVGILK
jgi:hypothetical protein